MCVDPLLCGIQFCQNPKAFQTRSSATLLEPLNTTSKGHLATWMALGFFHPTETWVSFWGFSMSMWSIKPQNGTWYQSSLVIWMASLGSSWPVSCLMGILAMLLKMPTIQSLAMLRVTRHS